MKVLVRLLFAFTIITSYAFGATNKTFADVIAQDGFVYQQIAGACTYVRSEISHGGGGGYSKNDTRSHSYASTTAGGIECGNTTARPAGYIKAYNRLLLWNGSAWGGCRTSNTVYNTTNTYSLVTATNYGSTTPCGNGTYVNEAFGYVNLTGTWQGGSLRSGNHFLPAGCPC